MAFYPICLILVTYGCIKLHDNNFRPVVWLWKPFHRHFVHFRRKWDPKASIINTFTTFLLLSFSKILFVSFTLLHTFDVRSIPRRSECFLYYDATVECSTQELSIFVSVAVCVLVFFILFPTLLLIVHILQDCSECVPRVVDFRGGMSCTCLLNHFRDSTRMEPRVLVTLGWFLQPSSSSEF